MPVGVLAVVGNLHISWMVLALIPSLATLKGWGGAVARTPLVIPQPIPLSVGFLVVYLVVGDICCSERDVLPCSSAVALHFLSSSVMRLNIPGLGVAWHRHCVFTMEL